MNIVFRVDASSQIGSGHVIRCLTLANLLRKSGSKVSFVTRGYVGNLDTLIKSKGYTIYSLPMIKKFEVEKLTGYERCLGILQSLDAKETVKKIGNIKPDILVIDHYSLDIEWESILRPQVKSILVIDDLANRKHDCDWLLDQNFIENDKRYDSLVPPETIKILGPKYALVSEEFLSYRKNTDQHQAIKRVFIFFGGADPLNLTMMAIKSLQHSKLKKLDLVVVIGASNTHTNEIKLFISTLDNAVLHIQVENIAELMSGSDIAIGAGGTSTWERFVIGLPSVVITFGRDQELSIKDLDINNYTTWLGNADKVDEHALSKEIINLIKNPSELYKKQIKAKKLVDGLGTKRVVEIIKYGINSLVLVPRLAVNDDVRLYWEWVNDKEVRKNAFNENFIDWSEHQKWFEESLSSLATTLLVVEKDRIPIGQVRFSKIGVKYWIDYSISNKFRGYGFAVPMLLAAIDYLKLIQPTILIAEVKNNNYASLRVFEKMDFIKTEYKKDKNNVTFEFKINY